MRIFRARASHALLLLSTAILAVAVISPQRANSEPQDPYTSLNKQFDEEIYDLFDTHCFMCHSGPEPKAGLDLTKYETAQQVAKEPDTFQKIIMNIRSQVMPPTAQTPTLAEREKMVAWINRALSRNGTAETPGRVTIRRLNKTEYNNTIQDLLYVHGDFSKDFPSDDVGYGFDNIGDVLTLTPLHIEMYLRAAREITEQAIPNVVSVDQPVNLETGTIPEGARLIDLGLIFSTNGLYEASFSNITAGDYQLEVELSATATAVGPAKVNLTVNGALLQDVSVNSDRALLFRLPVQLTTKNVKIGVAFLNDYYQPNDPNPENRDRNLILRSLTLKGPSRATLPPTESERRLLISKPTPTKPHQTAAREVLDSFATRAYRRPITSDESNRLMEIYQLVRKNGDSFEKAIQIGFQAILVNPNFLFRVELDSSTGPRNLNSYEIAARLSYFLWNSIPDQELTDLARANKLLDSTTLEAQIQRMLADKKAERFSENFTLQWLQIGRMEEHTADPELFTGFNQQLKDDLLKEATLYFQDMLTNNRPIMEFIDGKYTFINNRLARHYGIPGEFSEDFRRIDLSSRSRGGLLGMGAILTVTSNPNRTSPVKRGKFVMEQLLGTPPPPPPPDVGVLDDTKEAITTLRIRERLEQHRKDPACASCHRPLDAYGFTLENFNAIGQFRTEDGPFPVDNIGELPGKQKITGIADLKTNIVSRKADFTRTLTEKLTMYALGRGLTPTDNVHIEEMTKRLEKRGVTLQGIITEIVLSDSFRKRPAK